MIKQKAQPHPEQCDRVEADMAAQSPLHDAVMLTEEEQQYARLAIADHCKRER